MNKPIQVTMSQWTVLSFIQSFWRQYDRAPDRHQIGKGCGLTSDAAFAVVAILVSRGVLNLSLRACNVKVAVQP